MWGFNQHLVMPATKTTSAHIHSEDARESKFEAMMLSFWPVFVMLQTPHGRKKRNQDAWWLE
jgi:hypothetical protein